jgi:hypothetical protein
LSVALVTMTVNERGVTPAGGVSVMTILMVPVCGGFDPKLTWEPVAHPARAKSDATATIRMDRVRGTGGLCKPTTCALAWLANEPKP